MWGRVGLSPFSFFQPLCWHRKDIFTRLLLHSRSLSFRNFSVDAHQQFGNQTNYETRVKKLLDLSETRNNVIRAEQIVEEMRENQTPIPSSILQRLHKCYCKFGEMEPALNLLKKGIDNSLGNELTSSFESHISTFALRREERHSLPELWSLVENGEVPISQDAYHQMMKAFADSGDSHTSYKIFNAMQKAYQPNSKSFEPLIKSLSKKSASEGNKLLFKMKETNITPSLGSFEDVMFAYGKEGNREEMTKIMALIQENYPKAIPYQPIVAYYCTKGDIESIEKILDLISQRGGKPSPRIISSYVVALCYKNEVEKAYRYLHNRNFFSRLSNGGFVSLLRAIARKGASEILPEVLQQMKNRKFTLSTVHLNALLNGYFMAKEWEKGSKLFAEMEGKNFVDESTFLVIVQALSTTGDFKQIQNWLKKATFKGIRLSSEHYHYLIEAAMYEHNSLQKAIGVLDEMNSLDLVPSFKSFNLIADRCLKQKEFEFFETIIEAKKAAGFQKHSVKCYEILMEYYKQKVELPQLLEQFKEMCSSRFPVKPKHISFILKHTTVLPLDELVGFFESSIPKQPKMKPEPFVNFFRALKKKEIPACLSSLDEISELGGFLPNQTKFNSLTCLYNFLIFRCLEMDNKRAVERVQQHMKKKNVSQNEQTKQLLSEHSSEPIQDF